MKLWIHKHMRTHTHFKVSQPSKLEVCLQLKISTTNFTFAHHTRYLHDKFYICAAYSIITQNSIYPVYFLHSKHKICQTNFVIGKHTCENDLKSVCNSFSTLFRNARSYRSTNCFDEILECMYTSKNKFILSLLCIVDIPI